MSSGLDEADGKGDKKSFKPGDNDCNNCDSYACQSNKHGGPENCICSHKSKFNVKKVGRSTGRYILLARKYEEAHPGESLKGKRFKVTTRATGASGKGDDQRVTMISMEDFMHADGEGRVEVEFVSRARTRHVDAEVGKREVLPL